MFRTTRGGPRRREGFFDFFDDDVLPLLREYRLKQGAASRLVAHHVIAPGLAPSDKEGFTEVTENRLAATEIIQAGYKGRIAVARWLGCTTTRLQIMQGSELNMPPDGALFLNWQHKICEQVHNESGEGVKAAWWGDQEEAMTVALANGEGLSLQREFIAGIERDYPVGGHWTVYGGSAMRQPLVVAEVMYKKDGDEVAFDGFNVYASSMLTTETQLYMRFWRDVQLSNQASTTLYGMIPIF